MICVEVRREFKSLRDCQQIEQYCQTRADQQIIKHSPTMAITNNTETLELHLAVVFSLIVLLLV